MSQFIKTENQVTRQGGTLFTLPSATLHRRVVARSHDTIRRENSSLEASFHSSFLSFKVNVPESQHLRITAVRTESSEIKCHCLYTRTSLLVSVLPSHYYS